MFLQYYFSSFKECFNEHWSLHLFGSNAKYQSHTACCVGIWIFERDTVWLKAGLLLLWKEKNTFPRKERCMFRGLPSILQGYSFLKEVMPFLEGKLQCVNDESKVYFDMKVFCQGPETDCKNFKKNFKKESVPKQNSEKNLVFDDAVLMQFWCTFDALFMHFFKVMHFWCTFELFWCTFDALFKSASRVHQKCTRFFSEFCFGTDSFLKLFLKFLQPQKWTKRIWKVHGCFHKFI